jgi:polysaccharide pyruvyl transferase WcaK-like protein
VKGEIVVCHILYVGWIGFGNLGDELLWDVFKSLSDQYLDSQGFKVTAAYPNVNVNQLDPYDLVVLGGGSLILPYYVDVLKRAVNLKKEVAIWGSGLDWQSKEYLEALLKSQVTSESPFGSEFAKSLSEVVEHSKYTGVRGPLTYEALSRMGVNMNKVVLSGDPGLLVPNLSDRTISTDEKIGTEGSKLVGLNWGTTYNKIYGISELDIEDQLASAARELIKQGHKVFLYNVWQPDEVCSQRLYEKIGDTANVQIAPRLYNQHELVRILRQCSFTINFKLHANVLSMVADVPFIALGYRFKVFDFAESVDLGNFVISTDSPTLANDILSCAEYVAEQRNDIVQKFAAYRHKYRQELELPFINSFFM